MTNSRQATARSCSNIAFIKYWGNRDTALRLPSNSSISMNLRGLETTTSVTFSKGLKSDALAINGEAQSGKALERASRHLDRVRKLAGLDLSARVESINNFPTGAGIASSASGFAALTVAACAGVSLSLSERELSALARLGSGSACRSIPAGFVEWRMGDRHENCYAESIAPPDHWDLTDVIAIVSREHKPVGSSEGHEMAASSILQEARVADADRRLAQCKDAIANRDFELLADVIEEDALIMHAVMMTSRPPLFYWLPPTLEVIRRVREWRRAGIPAAFTIDAGPNVHVIAPAAHGEAVSLRLRAIAGVDMVLTATPGGPSQIIDMTAH